jgi:hypothetical protein
MQGRKTPIGGMLLGSPGGSFADKRRVVAGVEGG